MEKWSRLKYQPGTPLGKNGMRATAGREHIELSEQAAEEGMVLLKNDNQCLPLQKGCRVALFGKATFDYVKGGGGSGDVTVEYTRNLYEGFKMLGDTVSVYEKLADFYRIKVREQYEQGCVPGMTREVQLPEELLNEAAAFTRTAIISICRFSGEGWDRRSSYDKESKDVLLDQAMKEASENLFKDGDFYLTPEEKQLVLQVKEKFSRVIVVLNVGGMMDTAWFSNDPSIQGVLLAWQGGMEGGLAAARLLMGLATPSGKLTDTFAGRLEDYPSTERFHESDDYVEYNEDIYVGYRYFETIPGASERVIYPFGYGLSYTSFQLSEATIKCENNRFVVSLDVCNIGKLPGKEVVQVYVKSPSVKLGKPARVLVAFQKTALLQPGMTQKIRMEFEKKEFASYDDLGKIAKSCYVLEQGEYRFYVGTSVRDTQENAYVYHLAENCVVEQLSQKLAPVSLKCRMLSDGSYEELPMGEERDYNAIELPAIEEEIEAISPDVQYQHGWLCWNPTKGVHSFEEVAEGKITMEEFIAQLTDRQLAVLLGGQPNTGVADTFGIGNLPTYGIPSVMTADGPAGLRIAKNRGVCTTAWPCATLLACTWNTELVEQVGAAGGLEVKENNIGIWLTPAVNIHRSPLCGRNFEYYSEDPFLAGKIGAAMVRGIQSNRVGVSVKHFALNNKETNRKDSDSRASERAIREIYLKPFEIIVKEAEPWTIMSSYNIINGWRASECKELLEDILRGEWGYQGVVTTDWWNKAEHYKEILAGNDVKMARGYPDRIMMALEKGIIKRTDMEKCAIRILNMLLKLD